jgi:hypothetical protein
MTLTGRFEGVRCEVENIPLDLVPKIRLNDWPVPTHT